MFLITEASRKALIGLRDLSMMKWYVIPLLAIIIYIYNSETAKARETGDWNPIWAGLTIFGMDFINETWNGIVFAATQHSAVWTTPGDTGFRVFVGWNIEIIFWFLIAGILYYKALPPDPNEKVLGLPNRWFMALLYSFLCVFVECLLNIGGILVWEYWWWNLSFVGVWLIYIFGYFIFFAAANIVIGLDDDAKKKKVIGVIFLIPIVLNIIFLGILGWVY
ncbi:MAG: hypothetical protein ACFFDK_08250 [Promethearchaeota archaeon]